jgi:hypothetical protein
MPVIKAVPTPQETRNASEARVRTYLERRNAGDPPIKAATVAITASYPKWQANRTARVVSVFQMFAAKSNANPVPPKFPMVTEEDLVLLMLSCCDIADHPAPPGSPSRQVAGRILIDVARRHWRVLRKPLSPSDVSTMGKIKSFFVALVFTAMEINEWIVKGMTFRRVSSRTLDDIRSTGKSSDAQMTRRCH